MPTPLVQLSVLDVRLAVPAGPGVEAGMVVLREDKGLRRQLRIVVGPAEARAIQAAWKGQVPARPSTWDLYVSTLTILEGTLERAVITAVEEDRHWYAALDLRRGELRRSLACRPSDAIAIALRCFGAELCCHQRVIDAAGVLADGTKPVLTGPDPGETEAGVSFI